MSNKSLPPPPYQSLLVDQGNIMSSTWALWFRQLYVRVGSALSENKSSQNSSSIANNQSSAANITNLVLDSSIISAEIDIQFYITTSSVEYSAKGKYFANYKPVAKTWSITKIDSSGDIVSSQPAGITISITNAGQVQYTSTNVAGTSYSGTMNYISKSMGA